MKEEIPLVYKIILKRLWERSEFGKLGIAQTKIILSTNCRVGRENVKQVLEDLRRRGYVDLAPFKSVLLKVPLKCLV